MKNEAYIKVLGELKTVMKKKMLESRDKKTKSQSKVTESKKADIEEDEEDEDFAQERRDFMKGGKRTKQGPAAVIMASVVEKKKEAPAPNKKGKNKKGR